MGFAKFAGVAAAVSYFLYNFEDPGPNQIFLTRGKGKDDMKELLAESSRMEKERIAAAKSALDE